MPRFAQHIRGALVPEVVREVADHLVLKDAVREHDIEKAFAAGALPKDAGEALSCLERAGAITAGQVPLLQTSFADLQRQRMQAMLTKAIAAGLIAESARESGMTEFEGAILRETPVEFLVSRGAVTAVQAKSIAGSVPNPTVAASSPFRERRFREALLVGGGASVVFALAFEAARIAFDWEPADKSFLLALVFPLGLAAWRAWPVGGGGVVAALAGTVTLLACLAALVLMVEGMREPKPQLHPSCTMYGDGHGTCVFANATNVATSVCGRVVAGCTPRGGVRESRETGLICTGEIAPRSEVTRTFDVAEFDRVRNRAVPPFGDWRDFCSHIWVAEEQ